MNGVVENMAAKFSAHSHYDFSALLLLSRDGSPPGIFSKAKLSNRNV
jgi:hypothetical protein